MMALSKGLDRWPCGRSKVAFTSTITNIALMLTEAPERVLAPQMGKDLFQRVADQSISLIWVSSFDTDSSNFLRMREVGRSSGRSKKT